MRFLQGRTIERGRPGTDFRTAIAGASRRRKPQPGLEKAWSEKVDMAYQQQSQGGKVKKTDVAGNVSHCGMVKEA